MMANEKQMGAELAHDIRDTLNTITPIAHKVRKLLPASEAGVLADKLLDAVRRATEIAAKVQRQGDPDDEPGLVDQEPVAFDEMDDEESAAILEKATILLVDDEPVGAEIWTDMLRDELDLKVESFTNSVEAYNAFQRDPEKYDIIITDFLMPEMDGVELTREIRKIKKRIPVIAITGMDDHGWQKRGQEAGVNHVVRKPFDPMMFIDFIRRVIVSTVR